MTSRALLAIGMSQLINWGVLYYAFGVLLVPVERALAAPQWIVAGAFSVALLISAALAPTMGRYIDRGYGPTMMIAGGFAAAVFLVVWAAAPSLVMLYAMWAGLGVCMASTLYEPAFAVVGHGVPLVSERLRALALITIFGGLASTAFLPFTALLEANIGWRTTVIALAGAMTISALVVWRAVPRTNTALPQGTLPHEGEAPSAAPHGFGIVLAAFGSASLAHAALTTTLVPALAERQLSTTTAALLGSSMGLMQLPGRALMMHGRLSASPSALLITSLALQGLGMALLAAAGSALAIGLGVAVFAGGAGLATLVRPYLVQTVFAMARAGYLNGLLARVMQLARAAGPIAAVAIGSSVGYRWLYGVLALHFAGLAFAWRQSRRETRYP
jgi:hypothetical protein